jgi:hypothetical protein
MLKNNRVNKYEQPYSGPYRITQVNTNQTVCLKINAIMDTVKHMTYPSIQDSQFQSWGRVQYGLC